MRHILLLLAAAWALVLPARAADKLKVVATIPDLASMAVAIGGESLEVVVLAKGSSNLHQVTARPSHLVALHKADVFLQVGLSLETSFVPALLDGCGNARIQPGAKGFVNVSEGYAAIGVPTELSRKDGDVHPHGNPHLNLDPLAGEHMARRIHAGLVANLPAEAKRFDAGLEAYLKRIAEARSRWELAAKEWKGRRVAGYHSDYGYVVRAWGLDDAGSIEEKPGIAPTPNHLARVVQRYKELQPVLVLVAPWSNNSTVARVVEQAGCSVCELPSRCDAEGKLFDWIHMMDELHARLAKGFGTRWPPVEAPKSGAEAPAGGG
jgi:ABC-type Zn uptake system ZnuABC Zn-binding protein ZnuA